MINYKRGGDNVRKRNVGNQGVDFKALTIGLGVGFGTMLLLLIVSVICITNEYFSINSFNITAPIIQFLCVILESVVIGKLSHSKAENSMMLGGGMFYLLQVCFALLFFEGLTGTFWVQTIVTLLAIGCGMLVVRSGKSTNRSRGHRKRH